MPVTIQYWRGRYHDVSDDDSFVAGDAHIDGCQNGQQHDAPMVENMYASTVEQSCKYSGHVDGACSTRVSRVVTIAEFQCMPIIGTRPHSMAVAIFGGGPILRMHTRMVTAYLPSVYLGWRIPPILPRHVAGCLLVVDYEKKSRRAKARRDLLECLRRRVTLPHPAGCSTITVPGLSFPGSERDRASHLGHGHRKTTTDGPDRQTGTPTGQRNHPRRTGASVTGREPDSGR